MSIEVANHTPFPGLGFQSRGHRGEPFHIYVLKATFHLQSGERLKLFRDQPPLCLTDEYSGKPGESTFRCESDLAPYKPATDFTITGTALAPRGIASSTWVATARIGAFAHSIRLHGPRVFLRSGLGWKITSGSPTKAVPLLYELAFGGRGKRTNQMDELAENPIGIGYHGRFPPENSAQTPAPQIEDAAVPVLDPGRHYKPAGFAPVGKSWAPRLARAGTFDEAWRTNRWPDIPDDFDFSYYNGAHPAMILPRFLTCRERLSLTGLLEDAVETALPSYFCYVTIRLATGRIIPAAMRLDTVHVDLDRKRVSLVWRARIAEAIGARRMDVCLYVDRGGSANG